MQPARRRRLAGGKFGKERKAQRRRKKDGGEGKFVESRRYGTETRGRGKKNSKLHRSSSQIFFCFLHFFLG
jgi:hypothetical protein